MFQRELGLLKNARVVVALGSFGFGEYLSYLQQHGKIESRASFRFGHDKLYATHADGPLLLGCYHPSQQNTSTKKLTAAMLRDLFARARGLLENGAQAECLASSFMA